MEYLNAYLVSREYGGAEEGGWYYDVGIPVASIPFSGEITEKQREQIERQIAEEFDYSPSGVPHRFHLPGEPMLWFKIEDKFAEPYPNEQPRYS